METIKKRRTYAGHLIIEDIPNVYSIQETCKRSPPFKRPIHKRPVTSPYRRLSFYKKTLKLSSLFRRFLRSFLSTDNR